MEYLHKETHLLTLISRLYQTSPQNREPSCVAMTFFLPLAIFLAGLLQEITILEIENPGSILNRCRKSFLRNAVFIKLVYSCSGGVGEKPSFYVAGLETSCAKSLFNSSGLAFLMKEPDPSQM